MAYRKRQRNKRKLWFLILLIVLIICAPFVYKYLTNKADDGNNFISSIIKPEEATVETLEVGFNDYLESPGASYILYSEAPKVKGLYVNASAVHSKERFNTLIDIANTTEINAFVIDVKNDSGRITFDMDNPQSDEIKAEVKYMNDINVVMDRLYENDIYPIARIVAFKDPWSSKKITDFAIKNKDGSLWMYDKISWLNPYNKDTWDYVLNVAKKAAEVGFKEIQFDYIRFEATRSLDNADFGKDAENKTRMEVISEFVAYAMKELKPYNVKVSADVFGTIITSKVDAKTIGQDYLAMAEKLDVICPMVYPSHYGKGFFGIPRDKHSDLYPYETILGSMKASNEKYKELNGKKAAIVRPWLQAFTASYLRKPNYKSYGPEEVRAQIQATYDAGLEEWILWHAGSKYNKDALLKEQ
ncbi:putative glycoside hydrolase [Vallitalea sp.]|jgi:hypothetical protein|uniref:putative glycoside hydrolase n=1 Tax=Vallitalea sp. TaxID=1882829 RepID=UPI0025D3594D|nr:putative glycoside hydrolase [Vallitalea sp.]MCT4686481.1 putative glycoside hydrolase [Vallitalea sp.]